MNKKEAQTGNPAFIEGNMMHELRENPRWYRKLPFLRGIIYFFELLTNALISPYEQEIEGATDGYHKIFTFVVRWRIIGLMIYMIAGQLCRVPLSLALNSLGQSYWRPAFTLVCNLFVFTIPLFVFSRERHLKRMCQYTGAEHKSISCYKAGEKLTSENAANHSRFIPACGISFVSLSVILYSLTAVAISWIRIMTTVKINDQLGGILSLLSFLASVSIAYEIIKLVGRDDNKLAKIIFAPGMYVQRFIVQEPDEIQLEAATAALDAILKEGEEGCRQSEKVLTAVD